MPTPLFVIYPLLQGPTVEPVSFIDALKRELGCSSVSELNAKMQEYTFATDIKGENFIRSISSIDESNYRINFFCDIESGERLYLMKRVNWNQTLQKRCTGVLIRASRHQLEHPK